MLLSFNSLYILFNLLQATSTSSCLWPCTTIVHLSLPTSLWTVRPTTTLCSGLAETTPTPTGTTITECFPTTAASCLPGYTPTTTTSTPSITTTSTTHTCAYGPCTTVRSMSQCVPLYAPSCQPGYTPTTTSTPTSTPTGKPQPIVSTRLPSNPRFHLAS